MSYNLYPIIIRYITKPALIQLQFVVVAIAFSISNSSANEPKMIAVQMSTANDIQTASNPSLLEGVDVASYGAVYFPDKVFLANVKELEGNGQAVYDSWKKSHRFFVAQFHIGVRPSGDRIPQRVDVSLALDGLGDLTRSPVITGIFPPNGFKKSAFQGEANLSISAAGDLVESASAKAGVALSYKYSPAYASVFAGFATTHAFWQFSRTQESYPVGDIPMKLLLIVPKANDDSELIGDFDVKVEFDGGFFSRGSVVSSFTTVLALP